MFHDYRIHRFSIGLENMSKEQYMKIVQIFSFLYSIFSRIQTGYNVYRKNTTIQFKYGKIRIRKHLEFHQCSHSRYSYILNKLTVIYNLSSFYELTHSFLMHPFSTPSKHRKTVTFCDVLRQQRKGALQTNGLKMMIIKILYHEKMLKIGCILPCVSKITIDAILIFLSYSLSNLSNV